jgi:hypothetical protein
MPMHSSVGTRDELSRYLWPALLVARNIQSEGWWVLSPGWSRLIVIDDGERGGGVAHAQHPLPQLRHAPPAAGRARQVVRRQRQHHRRALPWLQVDLLEAGQLAQRRAVNAGAGRGHEGQQRPATRPGAGVRMTLMMDRIVKTKEKIRIIVLVRRSMRRDVGPSESEDCTRNP